METPNSARVLADNVKKEQERDKIFRQKEREQIVREKDRDERELNRDQISEKQNLFTKRLSWATFAIAIVTLVATIIGWFIK